MSDIQLVQDVERELTICDKMPIQFIGAIQSVGYVLALTLDSEPEPGSSGLIIVALSENVVGASWCSTSETDVRSLIGADLGALLDEVSELSCCPCSLTIST